MDSGGKAPDAFRTIGELSAELGVAQHILRYWETKFPALKPLQRAGNRRYYRPADVALARRIHRLLNEQGFTVKGAQKALQGDDEPVHVPAPVAAAPVAPAPSVAAKVAPGIDRNRLIAIRNSLAAALAE
ncbi:MerR family transcriptional regulator [Sphingomonas sp. LY29]|uniref:MerR family transcriptional regulator n=1 Tax=unclassified Sphingomonas TaxID=196159 RepID=UPI002ADEE15F|nr:MULTISPECIES: MerR family transcriptional regulator [unclassified Sphingomonas]MEA1072721.1 MerR family transcriptional regulator [Sphingomonas sp. LY160]WRP26971.1 MerR family transcriptional regulator [Sphingomonas sp. LY29]